ncbi:hypothetical protein LTR91_007599 [Friedmanniomyces endolithicus]|uniref:Translation initiation factor eIF4E3 n=1 Tax=Friedmanniomyces endolithicus TaxID=329885 RepID=A0AAN6KPW0_9PEZI|nr:hypothetical protein LTR75_004045 [Friedmanniomyces endolithicus]KAK0851984.1 hypothetical protein LTR03_003729 [Friedmanniomyces endolithicus]KAK0915102.1 hypothetical protein LTR02_001453 [Friedmanniomyces endolithicus]KAK0994531.1 hypothetical protein LTR91_007599 [Friedmanniomyces endolithicus]KAK1027981.1 hypothetical protein LTS16_020971 [Friedmanniomyces endolithicus]
MDKKSENNPSNLWTRRSKYGESTPARTNDLLTRHATTPSSSKLSVSVNKSSHSDSPDDRSTSTPSGKRYPSQSAGGYGKSNPFSAPLSTTSVASPTSTGASSAFGLGSGAFASFGSAAKTPKTPGSAFDFAKSGDKKQQQHETASAGSDKDASDKDIQLRRPPARKSLSSIRPSTASSTEPSLGSARDSPQAWPLKHAWVIYYRPPTSKNADYEKSIKPLCRFTTVQEFWTVYTHLKRPSALPTVSDYHFFKEGIRPVWEDDENRRGGKWIMKLKKGVADRYWEDLLLAMIGDQFMEASEEVCGAVVSVRQGEDVFSIWTKNDGGRNVKIRETVKRVLKLPVDTEVAWRSHGDSIGLKAETEKVRAEGRQERGGGEKGRRGTGRSEQQRAVGGGGEEDEEGKS